MPLEIRNAGHLIIKGYGFYSPIHQIPLCCEVFHGPSLPPPQLAVRFPSSTTKTRSQRLRISEVITLFLAWFWKSQKHISIIGSWTIMALFCRAVLDKWLKRMTEWEGLTMERMKTDSDTNFWKSVRMSVFQRFKFGVKIVENLQKCCCSMDALQEIAFNCVVRAN